MRGQLGQPLVVLPIRHRTHPHANRQRVRRSRGERSGRLRISSNRRRLAWMRPDLERLTASATALRRLRPSWGPGPVRAGPAPCGRSIPAQR
jgi:hypothetical protein